MSVIFQSAHAIRIVISVGAFSPRQRFIILGILRSTCWQWSIVKINLLQQIVLIYDITMRDNLLGCRTILILIHIANYKLGDIECFAAGACTHVVCHLAHRRRRHDLEVLGAIILVHHLASIVPSNIRCRNTYWTSRIVEIAILRRVIQRVMVICNQIDFSTYRCSIIVRLQIGCTRTLIQLLCHLLCGAEMPHLAIRQCRFCNRRYLAILFDNAIVSIVTHITCHSVICCLQIILAILPCLQNRF